MAAGHESDESRRTGQGRPSPLPFAVAGCDAHFVFRFSQIKEQAMEDKKLAPEGTLEAAPSFSRRDFVSAALGASLMAMVPPGVRSGAWAAGSDAPEKKEVRIGFIPLTDCASVVMARSKVR
jgi:hypothetical protein